MLLAIAATFVSVHIHFKSEQDVDQAIPEETAWGFASVLGGAWVAVFLAFLFPTKKKYRAKKFSLESGNRWTQSCICCTVAAVALLKTSSETPPPSFCDILSSRSLSRVSARRRPGAGRESNCARRDHDIPSLRCVCLLKPPETTMPDIYPDCQHFWGVFLSNKLAPPCASSLLLVITPCRFFSPRFF